MPSIALACKVLVKESTTIIQNSNKPIIPQEEINELKRADCSNAEQPQQLRFQDQVLAEGQSSFYILGMTTVRCIECMGFVSLAARLASHLKKGEEEEQANLTNAKEKTASIIKNVSEIKEEIDSIANEISQMQERQEACTTNVIRLEHRDPQSTREKIVKHARKIVQTSDSTHTFNGSQGLKEPLLDAVPPIVVTMEKRVDSSGLLKEEIMEECRACKFWHTNMPQADVYQSEERCCWWPFAFTKCSGEGGDNIKYNPIFVELHEVLLSEVETHDN